MKKLLPEGLSHSSARVQKGYYVWAKRGRWSTSLTHAWAMDDEIPATWPETIADETVDEAALFRSSERHKPHQRRKLTASYSKQSIEVVA